jgi:hypothetical protein
VEGDTYDETSRPTLGYEMSNAGIWPRGSQEAVDQAPVANLRPCSRHEALGS